MGVGVGVGVGVGMGVDVGVDVWVSNAALLASDTLLVEEKDCIGVSLYLLTSAWYCPRLMLHCSRSLPFTHS